MNVDNNQTNTNLIETQTNELKQAEELNNNNTKFLLVSIINSYV